MRQQPFLRRAVVIGRDQQQRVGAGGLGFLDVPQRGFSIVGAAPAITGTRPAAYFGADSDNLVVLVIVQRGAFAGRAAGHQRA